VLEIVRCLTIEEQHAILDACRKVIAKAPLFTKTMPPNGAAFRYQCTSAGDFGWVSDQQGFRYVREHPVTQKQFPPIPRLIRQIAIDAAKQYGLNIRPESALINWYGEDGQLGLHQDKTEISRAPVISISIGDDCVFIVGGLKRSDPKREYILQSGDVLIMGEEDRLIFHGVKKIIPGTAPTALKLKRDGRLNITVRQVYP
jgi:alkylated DNA repair protein (DNA oxidative demethylase)